MRRYLINSQQYDPFGMILSGRSWEAGSGYRYGFNGKENIDDIYGNDNAVDFGARIYDSRIARWLSLDPLMKEYPSTSSYIYCLDNPILMIDLGGNDVGVAIERDPSGNGGKITLSSTIYLTGPDLSTTAADDYNKTFADWSNTGNNSQTITFNGETWTIEVQMTFVIATQEDIQRITNAQQGKAAENLMVITEDQPDGQGQALPIAQDYKFTKTITDPETCTTTVIPLGKRKAALSPYFLYALAPIHEILHLYGLSDRYDLAQYQYSDEYGNTGYTSESTYAHSGYENDIMNGLGGTQMATQHFMNWAASISRLTNGFTNNFSFILSETVDSEDKSSVPDSFKSGTTEYTNPKVKE